MFGPAVRILVMTGHDDEVGHADAFEATGTSELERWRSRRVAAVKPMVADPGSSRGSSR
jgi:hypothetical protein